MQSQSIQHVSVRVRRTRKDNWQKKILCDSQVTRVSEELGQDQEEGECNGQNSSESKKEMMKVSGRMESLRLAQLLSCLPQEAWQLVAGISREERSLE